MYLCPAFDIVEYPDLFGVDPYNVHRHKVLLLGLLYLLVKILLEDTNKIDRIYYKG